MPETSTSQLLEQSMARRSRGEVLVRIGAYLTIAGMIFTAIAIFPLISDIDLPSTWWFLSMITGLGLGLILIGLIITARSRRRSTHS
ncbi:MAG: hypothetical protein WBJ33_06695 [Candidatus Nanopelagicales bacterium]|jgi:hypothetical protein